MCDRSHTADVISSLQEDRHKKGAFSDSRTRLLIYGHSFNR